MKYELPFQGGRTQQNCGGAAILALMNALLLSVLAFSEVTSAQGQEKAPAPIDTATNSYELIGIGTLQLSIPKTWQATFTRGMQMGVPVDELDLHEADTNVFRILVGAVHKSKPDDFAVLKSDLEKFARQELPDAGEKYLDLQEFKEGEVAGCYFSLTDIHPKPGEYKYLTQGFAQMNGVVLTFRIVSNRQNGGERPQTIAMIKSARILPKK